MAQEASIRTALEKAKLAKKYISISHAGHMDFSDRKLLVNFHAPQTTAREMEDIGLGTGSAPKILEAVRSEVWDFLREHLRL